MPFVCSQQAAGADRAIAAVCRGGTSSFAAPSHAKIAPKPAGGQAVTMENENDREAVDRIQSERDDG